MFKRFLTPNNKYIKYMNEQISATKQMTNVEIAKELGTTKQYITNTIKSALRKIYKNIKEDHEEFSPFEIFQAMALALGVEKQKDLSIFFGLMPPELRKKIKEDARGKFRG